MQRSIIKKGHTILLPIYLAEYWRLAHFYNKQLSRISTENCKIDICISVTFVSSTKPDISRIFVQPSGIFTAFRLVVHVNVSAVPH